MSCLVEVERGIARDGPGLEPLGDARRWSCRSVIPPRNPPPALAGGKAPFSPFSFLFFLKKWHFPAAGGALSLGNPFGGRVQPPWHPLVSITPLGALHSRAPPATSSHVPRDTWAGCDVSRLRAGPGIEAEGGSGGVCTGGSWALQRGGGGGAAQSIISAGLFVFNYSSNS